MGNLKIMPPRTGLHIPPPTIYRRKPLRHLDIWDTSAMQKPYPNAPDFIDQRFEIEYSASAAGADLRGCSLEHYLTQDTLSWTHCGLRHLVQTTSHQTRDCSPASIDEAGASKSRSVSACRRW